MTWEPQRGAKALPRATTDGGLQQNPTKSQHGDWAATGQGLSLQGHGAGASVPRSRDRGWSSVSIFQPPRSRRTRGWRCGGGRQFSGGQSWGEAEAGRDGAQLRDGQSWGVAQRQSSCLVCRGFGSHPLQHWRYRKLWESGGSRGTYWILEPGLSITLPPPCHTVRTWKEMEVSGTQSHLGLSPVGTLQLPSVFSA